MTVWLLLPKLHKNCKNPPNLLNSSTMYFVESFLFSMFSKCFVRCSQCVALTSLVNKDLKALLNLSLGFNPIKQLQINDDKIFYNPNRCVFLFLVSSNTLKRYLWESTGPKYLYRLDSNEDPYYLGTLVVKRQNINIESKIIDLSYQSFWLNKTTSY